MPSSAGFEVILESIARVIAIFLVLWPFVGIIAVTLTYHLFRVAITRSGVEISKPTSDRFEFRILICVAGAVLGWLAFLLLPLAVFVWIVTQFIFLVSGATKVYTKDHQPIF